MRRVGLVLLVSIFCALSGQSITHAVSSNSKLFVSADNAFYAYVKAGETISASFSRVDQSEPFGTIRGDVTVTIEGPGVEQQTCVMDKDVAIGKGCEFAPRAAVKTGVWRIQFQAPEGANTYPEASPVVKWGGNLFSWNITVKSGSEEQHGRLWTERYAIRQPAPASFLEDLTYYYVSEDGYIYRATMYGYNGQISTLSADSIGIRKGNECVSAYRSTEVSDTKYSPALGACGNAYKLFFEMPAGDLPTKATLWNDKSDWVRPNISRPSISELHFTSDESSDQQSGTISFFLKNFIGQYQVKIDVDNDGNFNGQSDVVLNQQMKKLSNGLQQIRFQGVDRQGQVIPTTQPIGVKVEITKVAEIHIIAADVEGRTGGIEMTRLNGDNAPTTRICWNDTELVSSTDAVPADLTLDGRDCPTSIKGVHSWEYSDGSWGNGRYIDNWVYASAKLNGKNTITYPDIAQQATVNRQMNIMPIVLGVVATVAAIAVGIIVLIVKKKRQNKAPVVGEGVMYPQQNATPPYQSANSGYSQPLNTPQLPPVHPQPPHSKDGDRNLPPPQPPVG